MSTPHPRAPTRKNSPFLWLACWRAVQLLRPACHRTTTFLWLAVVLAAFCLRPDLAGVTSLVRSLGLSDPCYYCLLHFFHSPAVPVAALTAAWLQTLRYLSRDLLWRPLGQLVRFVWVIHPTRGRWILLCPDLTMSPLDIIRLYGWRFKIEAGFWQAIHNLGAYAYHFWMAAMTPLHRGQGNQHLHRKSADYRQQVRRKFAAYERHIQIGLIAQGLLQYLALSLPQGVWANFHSYTRTARRSAPPSEWVVAHALRYTWPDFLCGWPSAAILKKFLAHKIDLQRAGFHDVSELDLAA